MVVVPRSLEPTLLKKTDSKMNEQAYFMCAFIVSYSVVQVCLEEQRNACRLLREDPKKPNLVKRETW